MAASSQGPIYQLSVEIHGYGRFLKESRRASLVGVSSYLLTLDVRGRQVKFARLGGMERSPLGYDGVPRVSGWFIPLPELNRIEDYLVQKHPTSPKRHGKRQIRREANAKKPQSTK